MDKFKKSIDKIELNENDKRKMLNNILNYKEEKKKFSFQRFILATCTFIFAFTLTIGTGYALVKYFKLDTKVADLLDLDEETMEQIDGNDINISKKFGDTTITIYQTILTENQIYIRLDLTNKKEEKYIAAQYLSNGNKFDESIVDITKLDDNTFSYGTTEKADYNGYGLALLDENENTNSYLIDFDYNKLNYNGDVTLRIYCDINEYYDITLNIKSNEIKTNKKEIKKTFYHKNGLKLESNYISISTYGVTINYSANDSYTLENFELYGGQFDNYYVTYKDGTTQNLYLMLNYNKNEDGTYNSIFGYFSWFQNIDTIKSITINSVTFEV